MKKRGKFYLIVFLIIFPSVLFCQNTISPPVSSQLSSYPKIVESLVVILSLVSTNSKTPTCNFSNSFNIGHATDINILYNDRFGFSYDLSPVISHSNRIIQVNNIIFDPGAIFRLNKGYSITTRMAFEEAGRDGESTVFAKVFTLSGFLILRACI